MAIPHQDDSSKHSTRNTTWDTTEPRLATITDVPTLFVPSLLLTVCCLSPFGLSAIRSSRRTAALLAAGKRNEAIASIAKTQRLLRIGFLFAIGCAALVMLAQILVSL